MNKNEKNIGRLLNLSPKRREIRLIIFSAASMLFSLFFIQLALIIAQDQKPDGVVDAPEVQLSEDEKKKLDAEKGVRKRTELSFILMESRLKSAEDLAQQPKFQDSLVNVIGYKTLLDDAVGFLEKSDTENDKVQNNLKRLEMILRKHITRLELIRRDMPYKYGWHVGESIKYVRKIRAKAIEPLFDDSVLPDKPL
jgi:hypothetical protein